MKKQKTEHKQVIDDLYTEGQYHRECPEALSCQFNHCRKKLEQPNCKLHDLQIQTASNTAASPNALLKRTMDASLNDVHFVESVIKQLIVGSDNKPIHNLICNLTCPIIYDEVCEVSFMSWCILMALDLTGGGSSYAAYEVIGKVEMRNIKWKHGILKTQHVLIHDARKLEAHAMTHSCFSLILM